MKDQECASSLFPIRSESKHCIVAMSGLFNYLMPDLWQLPVDLVKVKSLALFYRQGCFMVLNRTFLI